MTDDKRTFEANLSLYQDLRLQTRRVKGVPSSDERVPDGEADNPTDAAPMPVSQDLILRLIKLFKES
jgi:hypothetical protein